MKIWQRLKNLWKLSEIQMTEIKKEVEERKPKMASIIYKDNPIDKILENNYGN